MRIQVVSRWATCIVPSPKLTMRWILRSRTDSKSFCIRVPATVTTIPKGSAPPFSTSGRPGPPTRISLSRTPERGALVTSSYAVVRPPPNSTCMSDLRILSPSYAAPKAIRLGPRLAAAEPSEGQGRPDREVHGVHDCGERAQGEGAEILSHLDSGGLHLADHVPREKDEEPALLEIPDHGRRHGGVGRPFGHTGHPRHR